MLLSDYMTREGLSIPDMTAKIGGGITVEAVRLWVAGKRMPQTAQIARIIEVTGGEVTADDLYQACAIRRAAAPNGDPAPTQEARSA